MAKPVVLILHQDALLKKEMEKFNGVAYDVLFANAFNEAFYVLKRKHVSCIVVDPYFKGRERVEEIERFRRLFATIPVILYGRFPNPDLPRRYGHIGVERCIRFGELDDLLKEIPDAITRYSFQPNMRVFGIASEKCSPRIKKALRMMFEEFRDSPSVENIARHLGVSPGHLRKEWQRHCEGITPKQLLIGLKLHYSTVLMQNEGLKLKNIASLAGFANEHEFYRSFHSHMGMTPLDYRRLHTFAEFQEVLLKMRKRTGQ
ncbi:DNA-binding response regulator [candidate division KSB1 bacterium]|nr:DNA-binding response regulator [candidate division KSB1 bacterium]